jgi:hypothetical protein
MFLRYVGPGYHIPEGRSLQASITSLQILPTEVTTCAVTLGILPLWN